MEMKRLYVINIYLFILYKMLLNLKVWRKKEIIIRIIIKKKIRKRIWKLKKIIIKIIYLIR